MKEKLLKIINNYGVNNQQRKLQEEVFELQEEITIYQQGNNGRTNEIAGELADCMVLLNQFKEYYCIQDEEIIKIMEYKIDRQLGRIKNENKNN